jgi:hypothetical protein
MGKRQQQFTRITQHQADMGAGIQAGHGTGQIRVNQSVIVHNGLADVTLVHCQHIWKTKAASFERLAHSNGR